MKYCVREEGKQKIVSLCRDVIVKEGEGKVPFEDRGDVKSLYTSRVSSSQVEPHYRQVPGRRATRAIDMGDRRLHVPVTPRIMTAAFAEIARVSMNWPLRCERRKAV